MEIKYLTRLNNTPYIQGNTGYVKTLKPLTITQIASLETSYNNGITFPQVLRELLFLAGEYCYIFDYGVGSSQDEMQVYVRSVLTEENKQIDRGFFAVDVYGAPDTFLFVYLDEGDDPFVNVLDFEDAIWLRTSQVKLSDFINKRLTFLQSGQSVN